MTPLLEAALAYGTQGVPVFPVWGTVGDRCACGQACASPGKHPLGPLVPHGLHDATTAPDRLRAWWARYPTANLGTPTTWACVLDVDPRHGGDEALRALEARHGRLPTTPEVLTGGGGRHLYFQPVPGLRNSASLIGPGVDVRAIGGYVLLPPSTHISGRRYRDELSRPLFETPLAAMPAWLVPLAAPAGTNGRGPAPPLDDVITKSKRNASLTSLAGTLRHRGATPEELLAALRALNASRCQPPLPDEELGQIAASVGRYAPGEAPRTEDALALEFSDQHGDALRYVHEWRQWLRWDGMRWAEERTLAVLNAARALCRTASAQLTNRLLARKLESAATVAAVVTLARTDRRHARLAEDFDRDPWLLNTPGGTVDLRTGACRPHDREDDLTQCTAVTAGADVPTRWLACLDTWTRQDPALVAFLQRLLGYALTGDVREDVLPIVHGPGGNGKTKFLETVRAVLGPDYVTNVAMETLLLTKGEQHPTDVASLRGKRLAIAMETEEGRHLAEAKVKALTGGDRLRARFMRQDFFEFAPTHKLLIVGNHKPALRNVDESIRRRLILIPFDAVIPESARDKDLPAKLGAELPGILQWMIAGCLAWQREGLNPPARVRAATTDYLESADALGRWLEECCVRGPNETATKRDVYANWKAWAEAAGEFVGTQRRLNDRLASLPGIDEYRTNQAKGWIGLGLRPEGR